MMDIPKSRHMTQFVNLLVIEDDFGSCHSKPGK